MKAYRQEIRRYLFPSTGSEWVITLYWNEKAEVVGLHFKDDPPILPGEIEQLEQYATELWEEVSVKAPSDTDICIFDHGDFIDVEFRRRS